ncbi:cilia- and flagella-associated protein 97-like [Mercenaria mercenaria]|uniref:cilia- and flagella-associated protein 97-like n=1 Tax=Mercenaria mercenaria TaxID=6596 RepID=UPI00234F2B2F|nr:cilia- and flagella-associated protein 97-like [Mercenaria mercenaria]
MDVSEDVDFDFFDTPRNDNVLIPKSMETTDKKPPGSASTHKQKKHGDLSDGKQPGNMVMKDKISVKEEEKYEYSDDTFSSSDSESDTPRYERASSHKKLSELKKKPKTNNHRKNSTTESSSAYSNSEYSSDDNEQNEEEGHMFKKEVIDVHIPKAHVEAWSEGGSNSKKHNDSKQSRYIEEKGRKHHQKKAMSESSDSEIDDEKGICESRSSANLKSGKAKSTNYRRTRGNGRKKPLRSSSSYSNNSDITDVSPLESPQNSPRYSRKSTYDREGKENGKNVQYCDSSSPERTTSHSINLESDEIDLSILMKCMADIDREKQERLKTNSRRVMFAQPAGAGDRKSKGNYTFSMNQAKLIEKENQRLLKQIMNQMNSTTAKKAPVSAPRQRGPKKVVAPVFQRLTPSAVNRMREQRRIEQENMQMLSRLQTVRPSQGMSRKEQINEAQRQMSYGVPSGTLIIPGQSSHYDTMSHRSLHSSMSHTAGSTQRSRPSSAKSNASVSLAPGKRSRPSSAKSNASMRSNASVMSNVSKMSTASVRSNVSRRMADGRLDKRPEWNDRFSFS